MCRASYPRKNPSKRVPGFAHLGEAKINRYSARHGITKMTKAGTRKFLFRAQRGQIQESKLESARFARSTLDRSFLSRASQSCSTKITNFLGSVSLLACSAMSIHGGFSSLEVMAGLHFWE